MITWVNVARSHQRQLIAVSIPPPRKTIHGAVIIRELPFLHFTGQLLDSHWISVHALRYMKPAFPMQNMLVEHAGFGVL